MDTTGDNQQQQQNTFNTKYEEILQQIKGRLQGSDFIVAQDIINKVRNASPQAMNNVGIRMDNSKDDTAFIITFCIKQAIRIKEIIRMIMRDKSSITAAVITGITSGKNANSIYIKITAVKSTATAAITRPKYDMPNEVNDGLDRLNLGESDTACGKTIQKYMINFDDHQPLIDWSFDLTANSLQYAGMECFRLIAPNIPSMDLFYLARLLRDCPAILEIEYKPPDSVSVTPVCFSLNFLCRYVDTAGKVPTVATLLDSKKRNRGGDSDSDNEEGEDEDEDEQDSRHRKRKKSILSSITSWF